MLVDSTSASIEGVTGITVTMDEPDGGEFWFGVPVTEAYDFYGIAMTQAATDPTDWVSNGWDGGMATWSGTDALIPGGTIEMWEWPDDTPIASITDVTATGYDGAVSFTVAKAAEQPWAPDNDIYELTITFTPAASGGPETVTLAGQDGADLFASATAGAGTVGYNAGTDTIDFTYTEATVGGYDTESEWDIPNGTGTGDFTLEVDLAMDLITATPGYFRQTFTVALGDAVAAVGFVQWGAGVECTTIHSNPLDGDDDFNGDAADCSTASALGALTGTVTGDVGLRIMLAGNTLSMAYKPAGGDWTEVSSANASAYAGENWALTTYGESWEGAAYLGITHPVDSISVTSTPAAPTPDTTAPVIALTGDASVTVEIDGTYTEEGATATDDVDGDVTVTVGGDTVDTATAGTYTITYDVSDAAGNAATQVTRTVTVAEAAGDTTAPVITLTGTYGSLKVGDSYTDDGATASDDVDGDITANIVVDGVDAVDTDTAGTYTITYDVSDAAGNDATQVTRSVTVAADTPDPPDPVVEYYDSSSSSTCFIDTLSWN